MSFRIDTVKPLNLFHTQDEREQAVYACAMLAIAYLNTKADTQEQRNELTQDYYWLEEKARVLLAEASQRVLPYDTEIVGSVINVIQLPKE